MKFESKKQFRFEVSGDVVYGQGQHIGPDSLMKDEYFNMAVAGGDVVVLEAPVEAVPEPVKAEVVPVEAVPEGKKAKK